MTPKNGKCIEGIANDIFRKLQNLRTPELAVGLVLKYIEFKESFWGSSEVSRN